MVAFSDGRVTVLQERKALLERSNRRSAFTRGVEKAEPDLPGGSKVTDRELGTRRAYGIP